MHISLKELIRIIGIDITTKTINDTDVIGIIDEQAPFLKASDAVHFFQIEGSKTLDKIDWLEKVFIYDFVFQKEPQYSAMLTLGVQEGKLTELTLPDNNFMTLSIADTSSNEVIIAVGIESENPLGTINFTVLFTLYDVEMTLKKNALLKKVVKKHNGELEIKSDENFSVSSDLGLTQSTSGKFSFSLENLNTYFAIADTGIIVSLESMSYIYKESEGHKLILVGAGITLPVQYLKKAVYNTVDGQWEVTNEPVTIESDITLTQSTTDDFNIKVEEINTSFAIGDTGLIVSVEDMSFDNDGGIVCKEVTLVPPKIIQDLFPDTLKLEVDNMILDETKGFSGTVKPSSSNPNFTLGDLQGTIDTFKIVFVDNKVKSGNISGEFIPVTTPKSTFEISVDNTTSPIAFKLQVENIPLHMEFPPLKKVDSNLKPTDETFAIDLEIDAGTELANLDGSDLSIKTETPISFAIADSGIIVTLNSLTATDFGTDNYKITARDATLKLPDEWFSESTNSPDFTVSGVKFDKNGFSGVLTLDPKPTINLLGVEGELTSFTIENNKLTKIEVHIVDGTDVTIYVNYDPNATPSFSFAISASINIEIPLPPLKKVTIRNSQGQSCLPNQSCSYEIMRKDFTMTVNGTGQISSSGVSGEISFTAPIAFAIADTKIIVHIEGRTYDPQKQIAHLDTAKVILPSNITELGLPDTLSLTNAKIDCQNAMFSGIVAVDWDLTYKQKSNDDRKYFYGTNKKVDIFGIPGGIDHVALTFKDNQLTGSDITGKLLLPYFDKPIDIRINLYMANGSMDFTILLKALGTEEIELRKEELIALYMRSLELKKEDDLVSFVINGGMQPLLMASDGLEWPRLDVKNLTIEQDITDLSIPPILKFEEAWVDLKKLVTIDLWGFHFELNRIGMGYEEKSDKLWIDLTGNIKLIDQIPAGVEAKGFRITWPRDAGKLDTFEDVVQFATKIEVKFDGIYLQFGVPGTVEFEGLIRFIKEAKKVGFAGDMVLRVPSTGLEIDAGLMIGMNFETPPYPFLYMYFGVELPAGIPIAQSGLALKGAKGMFGLNVKPDKTPEQNWYYDWYKRGPIEGAHPTNKWTDARDAIAFGAGLTITTADGTLMGVKGLMVIALPGPFLMIEGTALVFDGVLPSAPLKALAIFDGAENTVQFNLSAEAEIVKDMLEAHGVLEAFFDFDDVTKWHLYLGEKEPEDRRIQANILKIGNKFLFDANAYLMIDMQDADTVRARMGALIAFEPKIPSVGPIDIKAHATIGGEGIVTINPAYFNGGLTLDAMLKASIMGVGVQANATAEVAVSGPTPASFDATLTASIQPPFQLSDIEGFIPENDITNFLESVVDVPEIPPLEIDVEFHWKSEEENYVPSNPLVSLSMENYFMQDAVSLKGEKSTLVGMDCRPMFGFDQDMNVGEGIDYIVGTPSSSLSKYFRRENSYTPYLDSIKIQKKRDDNNWEDIPLFGVWRVDPNTADPTKSPKRTLKLWSTFPFANVYTGNDDSIVNQMLERIDNVYATDTKCIEAPEHHVSLADIDNEDKADGKTFIYQGINFQAQNDNGNAAVNRTGRGVEFTGNKIVINFPKKVDKVKLYLRFLKDVDNITTCFESIARTPGKAAKVTNYCDSVNQDYGSTPKHIEDDILQIVPSEASKAFTSLVFKISNKVAINEIYYSFEDEKIAYTLCKRDCKSLSEIPNHLNVPILEADSKYRIEVKTRTDENSYTSDEEESKIYYFHTEGPPSRLDRYIKSTYPQMEQKYIFLNDTFQIRFKRPWINKLFNDASTSYKIDAYIKDSNGKIVIPNLVQWTKADSATLTPDEKLWYQYMQDSNNMTFNFPNDDILEIGLNVPQWEDGILVEDMPIDIGHVDGPIVIDTDPLHIPTPISDRRIRTFGYNTGIGGRVRGSVGRGRGRSVPGVSTQQIITLQKNFVWQEKYRYEIDCQQASLDEKFGMVLFYIDKENYYRFVFDTKTKKLKIENILHDRVGLVSSKEMQHTFEIKSLSIQLSHPEEDVNTIDLYVNDIKVFSEVVIQGSTSGRFGTIKSRNSSVHFNEIEKSPLKKHSRYELILSGGNGGKSIFSMRNLEKDLRDNSNTEKMGDTPAKRKDEIIKNVLDTVCNKYEEQVLSIENEELALSKTIVLDKLVGKNIDLQLDFPLDCMIEFTTPGMPNIQIRYQQTNDTKKIIIFQKNTIGRVLPSSTRTLHGAFAVSLPSFRMNEQEIDSIDLGMDFDATTFIKLRINLFDSVLKVIANGQVLMKNDIINSQTVISIKTNTSSPIDNIEIREAEILKIPFMTSGFNSLYDLFDSAVYDDLHITDSISGYSNKLYMKYIKDKWNLEKIKSELVEGIANMQDLNEKEISFKQSKKDLDNEFASLVLESKFYEETSENLEIYRICSHNKIVAFYLRSPQPLYLMTKFKLNNNASAETITIGKVDVTNHSCSVICSSTENQALLILESDDYINDCSAKLEFKVEMDI